MSDVDRIRAIRCADCAEADSAVPGLRPSQRIEMPADALLGMPDHVRGGGGLSRRRLLQNGAIGFASIYAASLLDWDTIWNAATAEGADTSQRCVVAIYLNGGNDGLNTFVPLGQYGTYQTHRNGLNGTGNIARSEPGGAGVSTFALPNTPGMHQLGLPLVSCTGANGGPTTAMALGDPAYGLDRLWGDGTGGAGSDLAIFPSTDFSPDTQSHFDSRDIWFRGQLEPTATGWIGRWLDLHGSKENPLQAVSLDSGLSKTIRSSTAPVSALENLQGVRFGINGVNDRDHNPTAQIAALAKVASSGTNQAIQRARGVYGLTTEVTNRLSSIVSGAPAPGYPDSYLSSRLKLAATLLGAGLGTRFVTIDWGSFDTHGDQIASQDNQLTVLSRALNAFQVDLQNRGIEDRVITMVFSEFGRRVTSNSSDGTDHGAGGPVMVSGSAVRGGIAGGLPSLPAFSPSQQPNLGIVTDFRTVYSSIISEWLGTDPGEVLPKGPFPGIQRPVGANTLLKAS